MAITNKLGNRIRFMQLNLNRAKTAHDLLQKTVVDQDIDIVIGQEPNQRLSSKFICDTNCDSFIFLPKKTRIFKIYQGMGFVCVVLERFVVASVYFSPNGNITDFDLLLDRLASVFRNYKKDVILGGDLNAKSPIIGASTSNSRGKILEDWISAGNYTVLNSGNAPTFRSHIGASVIDFTLCSPNITQYVSNWLLAEDEENMSDHVTIYFKYDGQLETNETNAGHPRGWRLTEKTLENYIQNSTGMFKNIRHICPETIDECIIQQCDKYLTKLNPKLNNRKPVYWWNTEIKHKRTLCIKARRELTRARNKNKSTYDDQKVTTLLEEYRNCKKELNTEIRRSKARNWEKLCNDLNEDVWGLAYQIAVKRLRVFNNKPISEEVTFKEIKKLFPNTDPPTWRYNYVPALNIPKVTASEVKDAASLLKCKKAAGPDRIQPEIIKITILNNIDTFVELFNQCIAQHQVPTSWKIARLVLIEKPRKVPEAETSYRPICVTNSLGKVFEIFVRQRLEAELQDKQLIHNAQFGFRKGKSTVHAIKEVQATLHEIKSKSIRHRNCCVMVLLDIKNAFNTASWQKIIEKLEYGKISEYLINVLKSFFENRTIETSGGKKFQAHCGVPQGSILGPTLWNTMYNKVLEEKMEKGVKLIAYADDLAVLVTAKDKGELEDKATYACSRVIETLEKLHLKVAEAKTEVLVLEGRRKVTSVELRLQNSMITSSEFVKYLGIYIGRNGKMNTHVNKVIEKAHTIINNLSRIMPRLEGPITGKRKVLCTTVVSATLYAAATWEEVTKYRRHREALTRITRRLALMTISAYRTVSSEAAHVLAGIPPICLLIKERTEVFNQGRTHQTAARLNLIQSWQIQWSSYQGWAKYFIKDIDKWLQKKGNINFYITQAMTGHGTFGTYLKKIKKTDTDQCWYCNEQDTPEHSIFICKNFDVIRNQAEQKSGQKIDKDNIADLLLSSKSSWQTTCDMLERIMKVKHQDEISRQNARQQLNTL